MRSFLDARAALANGFSLASFSHSLKCSCNRAGAMLPLCQFPHLMVRLLGCMLRSVSSGLGNRITIALGISLAHCYTSHKALCHAFSIFSSLI